MIQSMLKEFETKNLKEKIKKTNGHNRKWNNFQKLDFLQEYPTVQVQFGCVRVCTVP